jgi:hypothetical protein
MPPYQPIRPKDASYRSGGDDGNNKRPHLKRTRANVSIACEPCRKDKTRVNMNQGNIQFSCVELMFERICVVRRPSPTMLVVPTAPG